MPIAEVGRNCWRREHASRVAFLVDGKAYFDAFAGAVERAQHSILILAWDIDSRTRLWRERGDPDLPDTLGDFLNTVVSRRPGLYAHVLDWDFAMIYALEREPLPLVKLGWRTHPRLRFHLDGKHPLGASHHQKVVVIDDAIAFAGGLDLCTHRWDTRAHPPADPRRLNAMGRPYGPFHDVQLAVDGAAAAALGDLARTRWLRATGRRIAPPPHSGADPWPAELRPDLTDVAVAVARTEPAWNGRPEVREVEALFLDGIRAARRFLYIENQYLTSARVGDALAARLAERDGPEIVLVLPQRCSGWLEESTMGLMRARILRRLAAADRFGRLRVYYPSVPHLGDDCVNVHSKVMVVDDRLVRVGSANLSNRSMGFDTECDLAIDAAGDARVAASIAAFRDGLLGEHLGVAPLRVADAIAARGSLTAAVESLRSDGRTLETLEPIEVSREPFLSAVALADPERPVDAELLLAQVVPEEVRESAYHPFLRGGGTILALAVALALWTTVSDRGPVPAVLAWTAPLRHSAAAPAWVIAGYVVGGLSFVPVTLLILLTIMMFGVPTGVVYAVLGALTSAAVGYVTGRLLGRNVVRRLAGRRLNRLTRRLARRGPMALAGARFAGLVPFTIMNLVAGASRLRPRDYIVGTLLGTVPGVITIGLLARALTVAIRARGAAMTILLAATGLVFILIGLWAGRPSRSQAARPAIVPIPGS